MTNNLVLIRGIPGSGKSTTARKMKEKKPLTTGIVEFDQGAAAPFTFIPV